MSDSFREGSGSRSAAAERLLSRARRGTEPSAADELRVREQLHSRVLAAPLLLSAKTAHALATGSKLSAAKILLALGVFGGTAVVAGVALKHGFSERARAVTASAAAARSAGVPPAIVSSSAPIAPGAVPEIDVPVAALAAPQVAVKRMSSSSSSAAPAASLSTQDLQLEISGLRRAQQMLHGGNAAQAVADLDQLARQVPAGVLMEERDATRVIALCSLGRVHDAGVDAFLSRYPNSVHGNRVRSACGRGSLE